MNLLHSSTPLLKMTRGAIIAATYAVVTLITIPISFGPVQVRVSEALCILPYFFPEAIPGLFVGCVISNIFSTASALWDCIIGSLATLLAAWLTSKIKTKWLAPLPPIICNALMVGTMLAFIYSDSSSDAFIITLFTNVATVGLGEVIACYVLGIPLMLVLESAMKKNKKIN